MAQIMAYWKACMHFFLKFIDVWQIVERVGLSQRLQLPNQLFKNAHDFPMIKASMLYVYSFTIEFVRISTMKPLKKRGKFWKQHMMRAQKLLNPLSSNC
jgi:hypothetical protein